jgi:hypothetical protein
MIKVCFPPGCYGTYVSRCLYNFTNLRNGPLINFNYSSSGSSHQHRFDPFARLAIQEGHINTLFVNSTDQLMVIVPCLEHRLDYYNNQYFKQGQGHLVNYILSQYSQEEANYKLKAQWNYTGGLDDTIPRWIMREWCSFWITDVLNAAYNATLYSELNSVVQLFTQDIFDNYIKSLTNAALILGLTVTVDADIIHNYHQEFLALQKFHDSQNRCQQYVNDLIAGNNTEIIVHSIFDEAYMQYLLRQQGIEIQCDGLNIFPVTTKQLKTLTYETSNNYNQG